MCGQLIEEKSEPREGNRRQKRRVVVSKASRISECMLLGYFSADSMQVLKGPRAPFKNQRGFCLLRTLFATLGGTKRRDDKDRSSSLIAVSETLTTDL